MTTFSQSLSIQTLCHRYQASPGSTEKEQLNVREVLSQSQFIIRKQKCHSLLRVAMEMTKCKCHFTVTVTVRKEAGCLPRAKGAPEMGKTHKGSVSAICLFWGRQHLKSWFTKFGGEQGPYLGLTWNKSLQNRIPCSTRSLDCEFQERCEEGGTETECPRWFGEREGRYFMRKAATLGSST